MFCLRKKKFWGPSQGSTGAGTGNTGTSSAISNIIAESTGGGAGSGRGSTAHSGASGRGQSGVGTPMAGSSSHIHGPAGLREVTEDTPPDLLEGTMELVVILPSKKSVRMTVSRRTPVMDLLIQVTTANKINPGGHIVQVRNEIGRELQYKPSTPIGALDTRTIEIVPKHQVNEYIIAKSKQSVKAPQPFEVTFRLQVHLPKNQLHVMRVSPRVLLQEVLEEVCREKELDISKYEIRHPVNLDEKLSLTNRLGDYGLQQVRIVSKHSRINSSVSSADILALQLKSNGRGGSQGNLESAFNYSRSSVGESSVSSGSGRGTSPTRSDDSRSISPPIGILPSKIKLKSSVSNASSATSALQTAMLKKSISSNPLPGFSGSRTDLSSKKKRAPPPPVIQHKPLSQSLSQPIILTSPEVMQGVRRVAPSPQTTATSVVVGSSRSRQSSASDSSGYHEASASSILSDQQQEMIRKDRAIAAARKVGTGSLSSLHQPPPATSKSLEMSTSTSNLTSAFSVSTTSISSTGSRTKRKAPKPPATPSLQTPLEEELPALPVSAQHISSPEALERKPVQVQVDVHSSAHGLEETEEEQRSGLSQSSNKSSDTLKFTASAATCSTSMSSSKSGSTLTKSGSSDSRSSTSSRSSIGSLPPSPVPAEEVNRGTSPAMPSNRDVLTPLPPSSPTADVPSVAPPVVQRRTKLAEPPPVAPRPQPKPRPRTLPSHAPENVKQSAPPRPPAPEVGKQAPARPPPAEKTKEPAPARPPPPTTIPITRVPPKTPERMSSMSPTSPTAVNTEPRKFGVKVLPDNALQNLLSARLKNKAGQSVPVAYAANVTDAEKVSQHAQKSSSVKPLPIASQPKASQPLATNLSKFTDSQIRSTPVHRPVDLEVNRGHVESDDDLEENLELFEDSKQRGQGQVLESLSLSDSSVSSSASDDSSSEDDENKVFVQTKFTRPAHTVAPPAQTAGSPDLTSGSKGQGTIFSGLFKRTQSESGMIGGEEDSLSVASLHRSKHETKTGTAESLNRWKNVESLELNLEEEKGRRLVETEVSVHTNIPHKNNSTTQQFSSRLKNLEEEGKPKKQSFFAAMKRKHFINKKSKAFSTKIGSGDKHEEASSGSEASYADSGVPATATVTPSPVSLDPDVHEHHSDKSLPSSRRSSIHSSGSDDHSECWRELLETKVAEAELIMMDKTPDFSGRVTQSAPSPTVVQNTNEIHKEAELPLSMELEQNKKEPEIIQVMVHSAPKQDKVPLAPPIEPPKKVVPPKLPDSSASSSEVDEEVATIDGKVKSPAQPIKSQDSPLGPIKSSVEPPAPLVQSSLEPPKKVVPLKLSDSSQPSSEVEDDLITPAVVSNQQRKWSNGSSASTTSKGSLPSKSESFSYKGEFDAKKRRSSVTSAGSTGQRRPASKVIYTSSSEDEELRRSDKKHKSLSMQNLSKKEKGKEGSGAGRGAGLSLSPVQIPLEAEKVVKATSLAALPKMSVGSTEELGSDPKLMETFQVELEQQFEQWKEQFLQRHLGAGQKLSASGDPQREPLQPQKLQKVVGPSREGGSSSSSESSDSEGVVFDPEVPQAVHSVGIGKESVEPPSTFEPPRQSAQASISVSTASDTEIQPINESAMNGVPDVKMREKRAQAAPTVYRYSGPPAINMGTWGERVKRAPIAVKEDNDYIMGMGQNEAKSATVASRIHGFTGVPPVTTFQAKQVQNPAPVPPPVRRSNVEVKPIETGSSASVLATWKQRIDESEKSKTSAEVEVRSVSATNTLERPRSTLNKTAFTISSASNTLERPVSKRTPSPLFANPAPTVAPIAAKPIAAPIAANPFAVPIAAKPIAAPIAANPIAAPIAAKPAVVPKEIVIEVSSKTTAIPVAKETKSEESKISMEEKKRFFQGAKPETAPAPRIQIKTTPYAEAKKISVSAKEPMREDSVDSSRSASSCSSLGSVDSSRPSSVSLEEKKRFFQGIKPAESPTREVPVPAVNMKSSIATIQRVFEQNRNPVYRSISTTSLASDSGSSKVTTPSPSTTPSPYGTLSKHPSDFMVSQVIKGKNFDSVRRTPSPAVPETPKSDVVGSVRISTGANIQTHGNKAIILVGSEVNDSPKNAVGNVYRQHLKINNAGGTEGGATVKISVNGSTPSVKKPSTVVLNGNTAAKVTPPPPPLPKVSNSEIVIEGPKKPGTKSKIQEMQSILAQQKLHFQTPAPPAASKVTSPSVPPAPMLPNGVENGGSKVMKVPTPLSAISKKRNDSISSSSSSSSDGGSSVPATPSSPLEARAGILSAIKNSGGNFALKKTRSSILLN